MKLKLNKSIKYKQSKNQKKQKTETKIYIVNYVLNDEKKIFL